MRAWLQAIAAYRNRAAADCMLRFLRLPLANEYKQENRRETLVEVLAPWPDVEAFAALRDELSRQSSA